MWTGGFYRYEHTHIYTYEFQNILQGKLRSRSGTVVTYLLKKC